MDRTGASPELLRLPVSAHSGLVDEQSPPGPRPGLIRRVVPEKNVIRSGLTDNRESMATFENLRKATAARKATARGA